jgi:hypothetical protein
MKSSISSNHSINPRFSIRLHIDIGNLVFGIRIKRGTHDSNYSLDKLGKGYGHQCYGRSCIKFAIHIPCIAIQTKLITTLELPCTNKEHPDHFWYEY